MTKFILTLLMGAGILYPMHQVAAREIKEHTEKEFVISGNASATTLSIYNVFGMVNLEGTRESNKVIIGIDKTISADDNEDLLTGSKEFRLGFDQKPDSITVYVASPFDSRPHYRNRNRNNDMDYDFNVDFTVKVPEGINLCIQTVNNGVISVKNVAGKLYITNVNEEINIINACGKTFAHTVNGDVSVTYRVNPTEESSYQTINGDISVSYQPDLAADLSFKSLNGGFFTDFPYAKLLAPVMTKESEKKGGSTIYKLDSKTIVRFGKGGKLFKFETLNGNIYIKKQS
jgi:hypothetical protein